MKISIIVPAYNAAHYIERCLRSLVDNSDNVEIIVINDGSTDDTLHILSRISKKYHNMKVINQKNLGVSAARNAGLSVATGEYIMFCDSDDRYCDGLISNMIKSIDSQYDFICFNRKDYDQNNAIINQSFVDTNKYDLDISDYIENYYSKAIGSFSCCNKVYKRSILLKNKITFDEHLKYSEDMLFNLLYLSNCHDKVLINNEIYYIRYCNIGSTMYRKIENFYRSNVQTLDIYSAYIKSKKLQFDSTQVIDNIKLCFMNIAINRLLNNYDCENYKQFKIDINDIRKDVVIVKSCTLNKKERIKFFLIKNHCDFLLYFAYKIYKGVF